MFRFTMLLLAAIASVRLTLVYANQKSEKTDDSKTEYSLGKALGVDGHIQSVEKDGTIRLSLPANHQDHPRPLAEGWYLGITGGLDRRRIQEDSALMRAKIVEINKTDIVVKVSPKAIDHLENTRQLTLARPFTATTAEMMRVPEAVEITGESKKILGMSSDEAAALTDCQNRLKQIGVAMHTYHDTYGHLPPAVVDGPDGKPWHSWRVLLLPYLGQKELYDRYKYDEPWNGPNNKKLLAEMPDVFRNPVHEDKNGTNTHFAAIVGKNTVLVAVKVDSDEANFRGQMSRMRDITDGTANTLMLGTISPLKKIPWLKPEDVTLGETVPKLGEKDGFSTDFTSNKDKAGLFLFADGSTIALKSSANRTLLSHLFIRNDGNVIGEMPRIQLPNRYYNSRVPFITVTKTDKGKQVATFNWKERPSRPRVYKSAVPGRSEKTEVRKAFKEADIRPTP